MKVTFTEKRDQVVFLSENTADTKKLDKFPGFERRGLYYVAPAVLPVVYNLISRWQKQHQISLTPEISEWVKSPFKLKALPESFKFHTSPVVFQEIALRYLYTLGSAGLLLDPGMGKSKVVLDYIFLAKFPKSLLVCPSPLLFVWEDEAAKHRPELVPYVVRTTDWGVEGPLIKAAAVVVINYNKAVIFKHRLAEVGFNFIHVDEFLIKDPSTERTKSLTWLARHIPYRCGGSGTLINNSPLDVFSPVRYLQPALVGGDFTSFKTRYAVEREVPKKEESQSVRKAIVAFRDQPEIRSILDSCCIVMTKEEWLKLPAKHYHEIEVSLEGDQKQTYYDLMKNYYAQVQDVEVEADNALVMMSKLFQIAQGFLYSYPEKPRDVMADLFGEPSGSDKPEKVKRKLSERRVTFFESQPKVKALERLLTGELAKTKAIIWFNLGGELTLIKELLDRLGGEYLVIKGGDNEIGNKVRTFNSNPGISWLVCQAKAVNYGITVLGRKEEDLDDEEREAFPGVDPSVSTEVFFSRNFSQETYLQQQDRVHRLGQTRECHYYLLMTNSPVERKVKTALEDKLIIRRSMLVDAAREMLQEVSCNLV